MKLADEILLNLMVFARSSGSDVIIPNFFFGRYEMDLFKLSKNGYVTEYEVKISRADFKRDAAKGKSRKHENHSVGSGDANRFWFVSPKGLIDKSELPNWAGLLEYENGRFAPVKVPGFIHKKKIDEGAYLRLCHRLSAREGHYRGQSKMYRRLLVEAEDFIKKCKEKLGKTDLLYYMHMNPLLRDRY